MPEQVTAVRCSCQELVPVPPPQPCRCGMTETTRITKIVITGIVVISTLIVSITSVAGSYSSSLEIRKLEENTKAQALELPRYKSELQAVRNDLVKYKAIIDELRIHPDVAKAIKVLEEGK